MNENNENEWFVSEDQRGTELERSNCIGLSMELGKKIMVLFQRVIVITSGREVGPAGRIVFDIDTSYCNALGESLVVTILVERNTSLEFVLVRPLSDPLHDTIVDCLFDRFLSLYNEAIRQHNLN